MSSIGSVGGPRPGTPVTTPATGPAAPATTPAAPGATTGALRDRRLAQHAELRDVATGARSLAFGERGDHVRTIQEAVRALGFAQGLRFSRGFLDRPTEQAILAFQRDRRLTPTGQVDQATLAAIDAALASRTGRRTTTTTPTATATTPATPAPAPTTPTPAPPTTPTIPTAPTAPVAPTAPTAPTTAVDPLAGKPFMDKTTFATLPAWQWGRDSVELEVVNGVRGMDPLAMLDALRSTNAAGRTLYQRVRRSESSEAYTLGYSGMPLDEMRWDSNSHELREANKFVSLTIEGGRYDPDRRTGVREVGLGTDKMDDTYYDTASYDLLKNEFSVRGRARWDTDTEIRRLLIGVKAGTVIDEFGLKRAAKTDIRNDGASRAEIDSLDADVRNGRTSWNGNREPVKPLKGVYDALAAKGILPDVGTHEDVLLLDPKVHVRSVRSRFHLNETRLDSVQQLYREGGLDRLRQVTDLAAKARAAGGLSAADAAAIDAIDAEAKGLLDGSAIARAAEARLKAIDPNMNVTFDAIRAYLPMSTNRPTGSFAELEKGRVVAETIDELYHGFAENLDGARRALTRSEDRALEDHVDPYIEWQRSLDRALLNKKTPDAFLKKYDDTVARGPQAVEEARTAFNAYGEAQRAAGNRAYRDFETVDAGEFTALRAQIENEVVRVGQRQIEAAGSAAKGVWFDDARRFYVPESRRNTGNFLIDTMDMSEYVRHEDWESIPADRRTPANEIPRDKIFHATLVNETQIELGLEKPYLDRLAALQGTIDSDRASILMKWMVAEGRAGVSAQDPATFAPALASLAALDDAALGAEVARLNDFARGQGSALRPIAAADVRRLDPAKLTAEALAKAVRTTGERERDLDGALFVFGQYRDIQKTIVDAKGERIVRGLRDAGAPRGIEWAPTEMSKGDAALKILSGIP